MTLKQRLHFKDDSGAALIFALIFVTVVSVAIAGVLAYANANVKATEAVREQAKTVATAESAADVAINQMRAASATDCLTPNPLVIGAASVTCERDTTTTVAGSVGLPSGPALRALQSNSALEDAIYVKANGAGTGIKILGDVASASNINMDHGDMLVTGDVTARACLGTITVTGGTKNCSASPPSATDPNYGLGTVPAIAPGDITACSGTVRTFEPGIYTSLKDLNEAWSKCSAATVFDFRPGIYYFSFKGVWTINRGTTVGGRSSPLTGTPTLPGACTSPVTNPGAGGGVTFVFGDEAQLMITDSARVEICGRRLVTGHPPIAFYGLKNSYTSGAYTVPAQNGCVTRTNSASKCAVISTDNHSDSVRFYFQGHIYTPNAMLDLDLRKSSDQYLNGGLTVRAFSLFSPASGIIPTPLSSGPDMPFVAGRTVLVLTVSIAGDVKLRVKVGFGDPLGSAGAQRTATIYTWSVVR